MSQAEREARALLSQAVGLSVIGQVAPLLAACRIDVMPLKGVWLQRCVYGDAADRATTDVDVLVRELDYRSALDALNAAGWRVEASNASESKLTHPSFPLPLDLHCRLFLPGVFRLPTSALFDRGRHDRERFLVDVVLPDPLDVFAHLVGHFVKSRTRPDDSERLADFVAIAERFALDPRECARHLDAAGLGRAARYVLAAVADAKDDAFSRGVLAALELDPLGDLLARGARALAQATHESSPFGALPGFVLEPSLPRGTLSLARRALERLRRLRPA